MSSGNAKDKTPVKRAATTQNASQSNQNNNDGSNDAIMNPPETNLFPAQMQTHPGHAFTASGNTAYSGVPMAQPTTMTGYASQVPQRRWTFHPNLHCVVHGSDGVSPACPVCRAFIDHGLQAVGNADRGWTAASEDLVRYHAHSVNPPAALQQDDSESAVSLALKLGAAKREIDKADRRLRDYDELLADHRALQAEYDRIRDEGEDLRREEESYRRGRGSPHYKDGNQSGKRR